MLSNNAGGNDRGPSLTGRLMSAVLLFAVLCFMYGAVSDYDSNSDPERGIVAELSEDVPQILIPPMSGAPPDPCDKYKTQGQCNGDAKCVWCISYAIPSACYDLETAKRLPNPVFVCDKKASSESFEEVVLAQTKAARYEDVVTITEEAKQVELVSTAIDKDDDALCDPVKQIAGYLRLPKTRKNYFFWFFESRSNPSKDPVVLWLSGGPGCSSSLALFTENGPCTVDPATITTKKNPYSWNNNANLVFVDQPSGTGFSYGGENDRNEDDVARAMYLFVTEFMRKYPKYRNLPFYVFGESYAGHYVPASGHRIWLGNMRNESDIKVNLKGISVGNGMTNPLIQLMCALKMENIIDRGQFCDTALGFCSQAVFYPLEINGWNQYDLRIKCAVPPLCYDFSSVAKYLNKPEVRAKLGIPKEVRQWQTCASPVSRRFSRDWMKNYDYKIPDLLQSNIPVLIYAGDTDFICNWVGNFKWTLALKWKGSDKFRAAKDVDWNDKKGKLRQYGPFSFLRIYNAGHMVPTDQPKASLDMLNQFIKGSLKSDNSESDPVVVAE